MKIATFNVNNINKRLYNLLAWLAKAQPDVVCLLRAARRMLGSKLRAGRALCGNCTLTGHSGLSGTTSVIGGH
jgi:exonuclease III